MLELCIQLDEKTVNLRKNDESIMNSRNKVNSWYIREIDSEFIVNPRT